MEDLILGTFMGFVIGNLLFFMLWLIMSFIFLDFVIINWQIWRIMVSIFSAVGFIVGLTSGC